MFKKVLSYTLVLTLVSATIFMGNSFNAYATQQSEGAMESSSKVTSTEVNSETSKSQKSDETEDSTVFAPDVTSTNEVNETESKTEDGKIARDLVADTTVTDINLLQNAIDGASDGQTIAVNLSIDQSLNDSINIVNKSLTIDFTGSESVVIKSSMTQKHFRIITNNNNVVLRLGNIVLEGGNNQSYGGIVTDEINGGKSTVEISGGTFLNCDFGQGGAILTYVDKFSINGTKFHNNKSYNGGAIYALGGLHIKDSEFTNNSAVVSGGAIYAEGLLEIVDTVIKDNKAGNDGGGVYKDTLTNTSVFEAKLESVTILNNEAENGRGGGAYLDGNAEFTKTPQGKDNVIEGNKALSGGGIYAVYSVLKVEDAQIKANTARESGGAIEGSDAGIYRSNLDGNSATIDGGAVATLDLYMQDSVVTNNKAGKNGGGFHIINRVYIERSTLSKNSAGENGGGLYADERRVNGDIKDTVINGNEAKEDGGGIYTKLSNLSMVNTEMKDNKATKNGGALFTENLASATNSTIENNNAGGNGGAVYANDFYFSNSTITGNSALLDGGAIFAKKVTDASMSKITNNDAGGNGGAINSKRARIDKNTDISKNKSGKNGGAVYAEDVYFDYATISENEAILNGGGIYSAKGMVHHATLDKNVAGLNGGGIYAPITYPVVSILPGAANWLGMDTIISGNKAMNGGGIYAIDSSSVSSASSIIQLGTPEFEKSRKNIVEDEDVVYNSQIFSTEDITENINSVASENLRDANLITINSKPYEYLFTYMTIKDNQATNEGGGAYFNEHAANFVNSKITGNKASSGAGLLFKAMQAVDMDSTEISDNVTTGTKGGSGIRVELAGDTDTPEQINEALANLSLKGVTFSGNKLFLPDGITPAKSYIFEIDENSINPQISRYSKNYNMYAKESTPSQPFTNVYNNFDVNIAFDLFNVKYDLDGGTANAEELQLVSSHKVGETITVASGTSITKRNYKFVTWVRDDDASTAYDETNNSFIMPDSNVVLKATWKKVKTVTGNTDSVTTDGESTDDGNTDGGNVDRGTPNINTEIVNTPAPVLSEDIIENEVPQGMAETVVPNVFAKIDEEGTTLGYVAPVVDENGNKEWVEVSQDGTPLGVSKRNPKTGDVERNGYVLFIPIVFLYYLWRTRKSLLNR